MKLQISRFDVILPPPPDAGDDVSVRATSFKVEAPRIGNDIVQTTVETVRPRGK